MCVGVLIVQPDRHTPEYLNLLEQDRLSTGYEDALRLAAQHRPGVVVLALGAVEEEALAICRQLTGAPADWPCAVLALGPAEGADGSARGCWQPSAFAAGATACLERTAPPAVIAAQVHALARDERARRLTQQALRESEERLRHAIEATELGIFDFDPRTGALVWSTFAKRHFGVPPDAAVSFDTFLQGLHPGDRDRVQAIVRDAQRPESGGEYTTEYRAIGLEDRQERWLSARGRVSFDDQGQPVRFIGYTQDITVPKRVEEERRLAQARYTTLFNVVREGFAHYRAVYEEGQLVDLRVIEINASGAQMSGIAAEAQIGRTWRELWPAIDETLFARYREVERTGEPVRFDHHADGRWCEVVISGLEPGEFAVTFSDITERKAAEAALREANDHLREEARRKDEFIAILSHELRNPLAPIRFTVPLLDREALSERGARGVRVIQRQVNHLSRLLDDLLDVSRISRGALELRTQRVALGAVVASALEAAAPHLEGARHRVHAEMPEEPIWVQADLARLTQVVTNLVDNSAKCTPRGGRIEIETGRENGQAFVRVRDNGIGIPENELPGLFEMFRQVRRFDHPQGGLGIGLALSKRLIEMHGGTINAFSAGAGYGAEFVVRLPEAAAEPTPWPAAPRRPSAHGRRTFKVLIVDDNADLVEVLAMVVSDLGHDVRKALDGGSALAAALAYRPDVVLLDIGLPVLSGIEVARELRRKPETAGARLVAITGWGQPEDRARTLEAGFDDHLTKPIEPEHLAELLSRLSEQRTPRSV